MAKGKPSSHGKKTAFKGSKGGAAKPFSKGGPGGGGRGGKGGDGGAPRKPGGSGGAGKKQPVKNNTAHYMKVDHSQLYSSSARKRARAASEEDEDYMAEAEARRAKRARPVPSREEKDEEAAGDSGSDGGSYHDNGSDNGGEGAHASDDEGYVSESVGGSGSEDEDAADPGFAAAMAKIMKRTVKTANPVMAKRHTAAEKRAQLAKSEEKALKDKAAKKKATRRAHLVMPAAMSLPHEVALRKVATRGVIALFNAITKHQKAIATAAAGSATTEAGAGRALPSAGQASFLELLKEQSARVAAGAPLAALSAGSGAAAAVHSRESVSHNSSGGPKWSVLADDYQDDDDDEEVGGAGAGEVPDILDDDSDE